MSLVLSLIFTSGRLNATRGVLMHEAVHQSHTESLSWLRFVWWMFTDLFSVPEKKFSVRKIDELEIKTPNRSEGLSRWVAQVRRYRSLPPNLVCPTQRKMRAKAQFESFFASISALSEMCSSAINENYVATQFHFPFRFLFLAQATSNNSLQSMTLKLSVSPYASFFVSSPTRRFGPKCVLWNGNSRQAKMFSSSKQNKIFFLRSVGLCNRLIFAAQK